MKDEGLRMNDIILSIEKIGGLSTKNNACGIFTKRVTLANSGVGSVVSCILVKSKKNADAKEVLGDIFELTTNKLESGEADGLSLVVNINEAIGTYLDGKDLEVNWAQAFFYEGACYIARSGKLIKILIFDLTKSVEIKFETGSGPVRDGQIYVIATGKLLSILDTAVFSHKGSQVDLGEIIDGLATEISAEEDQTEFAAAFVTTKVGMNGIVDTQSEKVESEVDLEQASHVGDKEASEAQPEIDKEAHDKVPVASIPSPGLLEVTGKVIAKLRGQIPFHRSFEGQVVDNKKRLRLSVIFLAIVIVIALVVSVGLNIRGNIKKEAAVEFDQHLSIASEKYAQGSALIELNKSRSREILIEAEREVKAALEIKSSNEKAKQLSADIAAKLRDSEQTNDIVFSQLASVNSPAISLSWLGKNLAVIGNGKVFELDIASGDVSEFNGVSEAMRGVIFNNSAFVLAGDKIWRLDLTREKASDIIEVKGAQDMAVFLGNVYLLQDNKIDKYVPIEEGYSGPVDYLASPVDFGPQAHFAIDGAIWVSSREKIYEFVRGEDQSFEISGLSSANSDLSLIYTDSNIDNLYVVDYTNSALLVIGKDGIYRRAYQSPEFGRATGIVVDELEEKMYISVADRILTANL